MPLPPGTVCPSAMRQQPDAANPPPEPDPGLPRFLYLVVPFCLLALGLALWNNGFPLGYHSDEPKKIQFVETGAPDFQHPVLMLQVARGLAALAKPADRQSLARLARASTAAFFALTVLVCCLVVRRCLPSRYGPPLLAFALATSPILVMHAHYFKEDIVFTFWALATVGALAGAVREPRWGRMAGLGVLLGLAMSSQYKAGLLLPLVLAAPWVAGRRPERRRYYLRLPASLTAAAAVFVLVNAPMAPDLGTFASGLGYELRHAARGHDVPVRFLDAPAFHLRHSLLPGLSVPVAVLGLGGLAAALLVNWRRIRPEERLLALFGLLYYTASEATPLKPFPDFMRYMIPVTPVLVYFAVRAALRLPRGLSIAALVVFLVPAYQSAQLVRHLAPDTRAEAQKWLDRKRAPAKFERHAGLAEDARFAPDLIPRAGRPRFRYVVTSSFSYERFFLAERLPNAPAWARAMARRYRELFKLPYTEIRPAYRSFAFSNPVVRIVDVRATKLQGRKP